MLCYPATVGVKEGGAGPREMVFSQKLVVRTGLFYIYWLGELEGQGQESAHPLKSERPAQEGDARAAQAGTCRHKHCILLLLTFNQQCFEKEGHKRIMDKL